MTGTRVGVITHAHINAFLHFLKISGRWMTIKKVPKYKNVCVFLYRLVVPFLVLFFGRLRYITGHVISTSHQAASVQLQAWSGGRRAAETLKGLGSSWRWNSTCLWNFELLATNAPVWRAEALHHKCFSSLSTTDSANNVIPHLLAHVWARSSSQLSRLGLVQKACLKCSNSSSDSSGAARLAARLSSDTAAGQGAWSHTARRNSTFPSTSFVKKPQTDWDSMGRRIFELLQRDLSTGCRKAGSNPTYLYFLIPSLTGSDCSSHKRESKGCTTEWETLAYMYFFQMSEASEPPWSHLNFNSLPVSRSISPYLCIFWSEGRSPLCCCGSTGICQSFNMCFRPGLCMSNWLINLCAATGKCKVLHKR